MNNNRKQKFVIDIVERISFGMDDSLTAFLQKNHDDAYYESPPENENLHEKINENLIYSHENQKPIKIYYKLSSKEPTKIGNKMVIPYAIIDVERTE
ncbi:MAG: hypothetical protein Q7J35_11590 [Candidatus Methanoperedens sp.]|nr:hypothetical protein [Candidatus Methanoperedens sp.]